jgi:hypothetical protein
LKLINLTRNPIEILKDGKVILTVEPDGRLPYILMKEAVQEDVIIVTPDNEYYEIPCKSSIVVDDIVLSSDIESDAIEELPPLQENILYMVDFDVVTSSLRNDFVWATTLDTDTFFYKKTKQ